MKTFIAIVCLTFVAATLASPFELTEEQKAQVKKYVEACTEELKLTDEESAKVKAKDYSNPTENIKCFSKCFFEKAGFLKDGALQNDYIITKLTPKVGEEKAQAALAKCGALNGDNTCEAAFNWFECFDAEKRRLAEAIKAEAR